MPRQTIAPRALFRLGVPLLAGLAWGPGEAGALTFSLRAEFDTGATGDFASVEVTERGGDLDFRISLSPELGPAADLHEFYFNLMDAGSGLAISQSNAPHSPYELRVDPSVRGGAGAGFDYGIAFGSGAGRKGNGTLQLATFTLTADDPLSVDLLVKSSWAQGGSVEIHAAAHVQGTSLIAGAQSETVGGLVPEPTTGLLLGAGLVGLGAVRRAPGRGRAPRSPSPS